MQNVGNPAHFGGEGVAGAAEVGETEQGHPGLDVEATHLLRRQQRNIGQLLGRGVDVDRGIDEEVDFVPDDDDIHPGHFLHIRGGADDLDGRAQHIQIVENQAGDIGIAVPLADHHRTKVAT